MPTTSRARRGSHFPDHPYFLDGVFLPFAHRGGSARFPENTQHAFEGARVLGFRHIETDVQLSADGEVVIFHDLTLERTTNGRGPVAKQTWPALRALDAAHNFCPSGDGKTFPLRGRGIAPIRLVDALEANPSLFFNLEMKGDNEALPRVLHRLIDRLDVHARVLVASANDRLTRVFRSVADGRVPTSAGIRDITAFWARTRLGIAPRNVPFDALQVPMHQSVLRVVDDVFIAAAHRASIAVHVWTINDATTMRWLESAGVDGIMTDHPGVLMDTLQLR